MLMHNFVMIESVHGKFIVNRHSQYQAEALIKTGATHIEHELQFIFAVVNTLPSGAVALDAGANIGFICVPLASWLRQKNGVVHAFEPQRMLFYALCGSAALNDLSNLHIYNMALGKEKKPIKVPLQNYAAPKDFGAVSLKDQKEIESHEMVDATRIDDLGLPRLDFLKIDVEGMEIDVLSGARKTIKDHRPWCLIEYWMIDGFLLKEEFKDLNYELYRMDHLNVLCAPVEKLLQSRINISAPKF